MPTYETEPFPTYEEYRANAWRGAGQAPRPAKDKKEAEAWYQSYLRAKSAHDLRQQRQQQESAESRRGTLQQGLGSDAQFAADRIAGYTGQYKTAERRFWQAEEGQTVTEANDLMAQALEAAKAGNFDLADSLKAQADEMVVGGLEGGGILQGTPLEGVDPALASPTGQLVGGLVRTAQGLQDPNSATTREFKSSLTEGALAEIEAGRTSANRATAAEERSFARQQRDFQLQRGGARNPHAERALAQRGAERFAGVRAETELGADTARAQVVAQANQFYVTYRDTLAQDAAQAAEMWVSSQAGVRDSFTALQQQLTQFTVDYMSRRQTEAQEFIIEENRRRMIDRQMEQDQMMAWVDLAAGIAGAVLGGAAGSPLGFLGAFGIGGPGTNTPATG